MDVKLYGDAGKVLIEGRMPEHTTLDDVRCSLLSSLWRLDRSGDGKVLAHPGGITVDSVAPTEREDQAEASGPVAADGDEGG